MYAILFCQMIKVHKLLLSSLFYKFHVSRSELLHYHLFSCGTQWPTKQSYGPNEWQKHTHFGWSHFRLVCLQTKMSQCMVLVCDVPLSLGHTVGCAGRGTPLVGCKLIPFEGFFDYQVTWQFPGIKSHSQVERKTERIIKSTLLHDLPQGLS